MLGKNGGVDRGKVIMRWLITFFEVELLLIEFVLCWNLQKRRVFWLRLIASLGVFLLLDYLTGQVSVVAPWMMLWMIVRFLVLVIMSAGVLWFSFHMKLKQLIFYTCVAQTIQHMVHCTARVLGILMPMGNMAAQVTETVLLVFALLVCVFVLRDMFRSSEAADMKNTDLLVFAIVSTLLIFFVSVATTWMEGETAGEQFFDLFSCVLILMILFDIFRLRRAEREQYVMLRLLRQEQDQHKLSKATVEIINRKCHDLRHQISALQNMSGEQQRESIRELEQEVLIYDAFAKTGNPDLDIILAEKGLLAEKQGITIQCMADGQKLGFMRAEDIYSLMGNALDNAIEASAGEVVQENRVVEMNLFSRGSFLYIHIANPCSREPVFADGLPLTTKEDTDYHGYGMKSIRLIAEKYHGAVTAQWEEGVFSLDIILPV